MQPTAVLIAHGKGFRVSRKVQCRVCKRLYSGRTSNGDAHTVVRPAFHLRGGRGTTKCEGADQEALLLPEKVDRHKTCAEEP